MVFIAYAEARAEGASFSLFRTKQQAVEFGRATVFKGGGRVRIYKVDHRRIADARTSIPRGDLFAVEVITARSMPN
jgi:hypothetical protein